MTASAFPCNGRSRSPTQERATIVVEPGPRHRHLKYATLLFMLVFVVILRPLMPRFLGNTLLQTGLTLTLMACVAVVGHSRRGISVAAGLCVIPVLTILAPTHDLQQMPWRMLLQGSFLLYATISILLDVFSARDVTADKLFGSICAYLLVGISFAMAYLVLEILAPGSFRVDGAIPPRFPYEQISEKFSEFIYYSFMTMLTVGYGDIFPLTAAGRSLATAQAIFGQFYMALTVSRLLSTYLKSREPNKP